MNFNFLPSEIILVVFKYLSFDDLKNASIVCKKWHQVIERENFWKYKIKQELKVTIDIKLDLTSLKKIYFNKIIGRNLIRNSCCQYGLEKWFITFDKIDKDFRILDNSSDTDGFIIEEYDECSVPAFDEKNRPIKKFATSYFPVYKYQLIDLLSEGLSSNLIEKLNPVLLIKDFYAARLYLGFEYYVKIILYDYKFEVIDLTEFDCRVNEEEWSNGNWKEFIYKFKNLSKNLRYVLFFHGGKDTVYWHGHYGVKLTNSQIRILIE